MGGAAIACVIYPVYHVGGAAIACVIYPVYNVGGAAIACVIYPVYNVGGAAIACVIYPVYHVGGAAIACVIYPVYNVGGAAIACVIYPVSPRAYGEPLPEAEETPYRSRSKLYRDEYIRSLPGPYTELGERGGSLQQGLQLVPSCHDLLGGVYKINKFTKYIFFSGAGLQTPHPGYGPAYIEFHLHHVYMSTEAR